jgi:hypothetical protein
MPCRKTFARGQHDRGAARVEALRGQPSASARRAVNRIWARLGFPFGASSGRLGSLFMDPETLVKQRRRMGNSQPNGPKYCLVRPNRKPTSPPPPLPPPFPRHCPRRCHRPILRRPTLRWCFRRWPLRQQGRRHSVRRWFYGTPSSSSAPREGLRFLFGLEAEERRVSW